jgi:hypothetical protein
MKPLTIAGKRQIGQMDNNQRTEHAINSKIQYLRDRKKYGFGILEKIAVSFKTILIF